MCLVGVGGEAVVCASSIYRQFGQDTHILICPFMTHLIITAVNDMEIL